MIERLPPPQFPPIPRMREDEIVPFVTAPQPGEPPLRVGPPAADIPPENRGDAARQALGECVRRLCLPSLLGGACWCWSDIVIYSAAVGMILLGATSMFRR